MASILVTGATGYIGGRLVPELLEAGHAVRCLARAPEKLAARPWRDRVEVAPGDVTDAGSLAAALDGVDAGYFLVHSMGATADFAAADRDAAATFRDACAAAGVGRIAYLGGLGRDDDPDLSPHLRSRHEVGRILADGPVPTTELRAALVIGSGSASFEMLRYLVEVLPVMTTPRWVDNRCQPIAIGDVLAWLVHAVDDPSDRDDHVVEVGGPDVLTYREMMQVYAREAGLRRRGIVSVPVLTPNLSSRWVGLVTPLPAGLARPLVESLINEVVVTEAPAITPPGRPATPFRDAVQLALRRSASLPVGARPDGRPPAPSPADPAPTDPAWAGGSLLVDRHHVACAAPAADLWAVLSEIGGDRGWYGGDLAWTIRGALDRAVGGIGVRRERTDPDELAPGDIVDSWRVEEVGPGRTVRLRTEMRLPGEAWLEWRVTDGADGTSRLDQRSSFYPRGLLGRAYWYALAPAHLAVFARMAHRITRAAEQRAGRADGTSVEAALTPR